MSLGGRQPPETKRHVLGHGEVGEKSILLEDHPDAPGFGWSVSGRAGHSAVLDEDLSPVDALEAGYQAQDRRFSTPAGSENGQDLTLGEVEGDVLDGDDLAEALADPRAPDDRRRHGLALPSLTTRNAIGTDEVRINIRAGAAERAKNASSAADQIDVASVLNSSGPRISVAGSSFIVMRNTSATPASSPGRSRGSVTPVITWTRPASQAARGLLQPGAYLNERGAHRRREPAGRNSTTYAKTRSHTV